MIKAVLDPNNQVAEKFMHAVKNITFLKYFAATPYGRYAEHKYSS